ncbi:MAG: transposase [Actinomycetaceae bacterium]|nr:transposase [Actinomycetaceae bacterium]
MPKKEMVSFEEKHRLVLACINRKIGVCEAARMAQVAHSSVQKWVKRYEAEGVDGLLAHAKNRTYSTELKTEAVLAYLHGKGSLLEICKEYKIRSTRQLTDWIKVYNAHGDFNSVKHSGGGSYMKKARSTTQEERLQIVKECLESDRNYGELALKYNVSYQQVRTWTLRFEELGEAGLEDRRGKRKKDQTPRTELEAAQIEIEQLKHKLYLAEMENHLLKKLDEVVRRDALDK